MTTAPSANVVEWPREVWVNGRIVGRSEAGVSVEDRGLQFGDGLYEVIRAYGGKLFRMDSHMRRLVRGAEFLELPLTPEHLDEIRAVCDQLVARSAVPDAAVIMFVTRGAASRSHAPPAGMRPTIVIFGASGDLTSRKLIPALYRLFRKGRLPEGAKVVGFARSDFSHDGWRERLAATTRQHVGAEFDAEAWRSFASALFYQRGDIQAEEDFPRLADALRELEEGRPATRLYYRLSPRLVTVIARAPWLRALLDGLLSVAANRAATRYE